MSCFALVEMTHGAKLDEISKSFCIPIHPLQGSHPSLQKKGGRWSISSHILCRKRNPLMFRSQLESWCQFKSHWSQFLPLSKFLSAAAFMKREYPFAPCYDLELFILRQNYRLNSKWWFSTFHPCLVAWSRMVALWVWSWSKSEAKWHKVRVWLTQINLGDVKPWRGVQPPEPSLSITVRYIVPRCWNNCRAIDNLQLLGSLLAFSSQILASI